ncbi:TonB family protein [bacterium]|nr:TonB family protein [bacterium]
MKQCLKIQNLLLDYLDSNVKITTKNQIEKHLKSCSNCRLELKKLEETLLEIRSTKVSIKPPEYIDQIILSEARNHANLNRESVFWDILFKPLPAAAAATILMLIITGVFLKEYSSVEKAVVGTSKSESFVKMKEINEEQKKFEGTEKEDAVNIVFYNPETKGSSLGTQAAKTVRKSGRKQLEMPVPERLSEVVLNEELASLSFGRESSENPPEIEKLDLSSHIQSQEHGIIKYFLEPGVTAPVVQHKPNPLYPPAMKNTRTSGQVVVNATVDVSGRLDNPKIIISTHEAFSREVLKTLKLWSFKPGLLNSRAVQVPCRLQFEFVN